MVKINPYLNFKGKCEEAFVFYKSVFGGEFIFIQRFKDTPPEYQSGPEDAEKIMHVALVLEDGSMIMGSDVPSSMENDLPEVSNITLSYSAKSEEEATKVFNMISSYGKVNMPLQKSFWGSLFGMATDKYGINWMVDCPLNEGGNQKQA